MTDRNTELSIYSLCRLHNSTCSNSNCFWSHHLVPTYFCVLPSDLEGDCVPDSLQAGHGIRLDFPNRFVHRSDHKNGFEIFSSSHLKSGYIKSVCTCNSPGTHLALFDALCDLFNQPVVADEHPPEHC